MECWVVIGIRRSNSPVEEIKIEKIMQPDGNREKLAERINVIMEKIASARDVTRVGVKKIKLYIDSGRVL